MIKNAIILAGGKGTRLKPFTNAINKALLNVAGKAVIDYPIQTLKDLGVTNLTVTLGGDHFNQIINYLEDGSRYGLKINYVFQGEPQGIAHAINLCSNFVDDKFAVILGDNFFEKPVLFDNNSNCQIVLNKCENLNRFGVANIENNKISSIVEKPDIVNDNSYAVSGLYLFDQNFFKYFKLLKKSNRNEYEIVDIINQYKNDNLLSYKIYEGLWSDAGTLESLNKLNALLLK